MNFYNELQLDPAILKSKIAKSQSQAERRHIYMVIAVRSVLIVMFAIAFIAPLSALFGNENSPAAVALFCMLLSIRFVDFGYCISDSLISLAFTIIILLFAPTLAYMANPLVAAIIHFFAFFAILLMVSETPQMGNGALYGFAYVYLVGNPVVGYSLINRGIVMLIGYIICAVILYAKHKHKNKEVRFYHIAKRFSISSEKSRWQIRLAIGVASVLTIGKLFNIERFMWAGFACSSLLASYPINTNTKDRFSQRIIGSIAGSLLFFVIYSIMPASFHSFLGPLGGICLGFCAEYKYKTVINCFGALLAATEIYDLNSAVILRITNNILGAAIGIMFIILFKYITEKRFSKEASN